MHSLAMRSQRLRIAGFFLIDINLFFVQSETAYIQD